MREEYDWGFDWGIKDRVMFGVPHSEDRIIDDQNEFEEIRAYRSFVDKIDQMKKGYWLDGSEHQIDGKIYYNLDERRFFQFQENKQIGNLFQPHRYGLMFTHNVPDDIKRFRIYDHCKNHLFKPHEAQPDNRFVIRTVMIIELSSIVKKPSSGNIIMMFINELHGILRTEEEHILDLHLTKRMQKGGK